MINETTPGYIIDLKNDLINHIDVSIDNLVINIYKTVVLKQDIEDIREDIEGMREEMVTKEDIKNMATKDDIKPVLQLIGSYEVRAKNIEAILLEDHKPRIADLEKEVFSIA